MIEFEKVTKLCEADNMFKVMEENSEMADYLFAYFDKLCLELSRKSIKYKMASDAKNKIMEINKTLWNLVENNKSSALSEEDAKMLMQYFDSYKDEINQTLIATYLQGVKDGMNGDYTLDYPLDSIMSHRAFELVIELSKETGKSIDEIANFICS